MFKVSFLSWFFYVLVLVGEELGRGVWRYRRYVRIKYVLGRAW